MKNLSALFFKGQKEKIEHFTENLAEIRQVRSGEIIATIPGKNGKQLVIKRAKRNA